MLFNSYSFIFVYLPIVLFGFFLIARKSHRLAASWLAVASLFFYGWWNPRFLFLLLASIVFNYCLGYAIGHSKGTRAKALLIIAIVTNLALLSIFKYMDFFIVTANSGGANIHLLHIVLPLGISFFTFTQIAFLVDVYRRDVLEYNAVHYLLFITWFPHLIAGPVLHHKQMMPQFDDISTYRPNVESLSVGMTLLAFGLFKKVILADQFGLYANGLFDSVDNGLTPTLFTSWIGVLAYTLQLYFDFSGYSDMAIGLSRLFNIKLPLNFNSPYKASSVIEFWSRWHMTLSRFLRDYLYIPLGGNRKGKVRRGLNLMITMLLGGLWHGAAWGFVLWGGLHGIYLVINYLWRWLKKTADYSERKSRLGQAISVLLTFIVTVFAWVPFRATSLDSTLLIWRGMIGANGFEVEQFFASASAVATPLAKVGAWLCAGLIIVWGLPNTQQILATYAPAWEHVADDSRFKWKWSRFSGILGGIVLAVSLLAVGGLSPFLYFQF